MKPIPMLSLLFAICLSFCGKSGQNNISNDPVEIQSRILTHNLSFPWEILWGPDNHIWMTERGGTISRVDPANGAVTPLLTVSEVLSQGEGGMLGMVLHPQFNSNPYVYVAYDYSNAGNYRGKVVRYTYQNGSLVSPIIILNNITAAGIHNGCRLLITPDLTLYITTGDASNQSLPQNSGSINGKILRVNLDGSIPADNPFPGSPVWTLGHRNPQGLVFANNILYSAEHGPDTDDEVNIIEKGRNYGWPDVRGYCDAGEQSFCNSHHVKEPIQAWTPTAATSGLDFYNSDSIPQWKNSLLVATLKNARLIQLKLSDDHKTVKEVNEFFTNQYGRMRDICISPDGKVYICTSNGSDDMIIEVKKK